MVAVQIISTGQVFQVANEDISYTKQVADLGDVTKSNAGYSFNMVTPKTPENTMILEGLGISGDTSNIPYQKMFVRLVNDGITIVEKGLMSVAETTDEYKLFIQDGIIEFFKEIKDSKLGEVLDLSALEHANDAPTIINSISADLPYKYVLADFNGAPLNNLNGVTNLSPTALVPSVNVKWLWDKVFQHYQWRYELNGADTQAMAEMWLSYPNALGYDEANDVMVYLASEFPTDDRPLNADFIPDKTQFYNYEQTESDLRWSLADYFWQAELREIDNILFQPDRSFGELDAEGRYYTIKKKGLYRVSWDVQGKASVEGQSKEDFKHEYGTFLIVNQTYHWEQYNSSNDFGENITTKLLSLEVGDTVSLGGVGHWNYHTVEFAKFEIYQAGVQDVDFAEALLKFKVKDFFKEVMLRFALTAFPDVSARKIKFLNLNERLSAEAIDWTGKFVRRESESYTYKNYAQNNFVRHKYDNDDNEFNDGNLGVANQNLDVERDLFSSKTYSPERVQVPWNGNAQPVYYVPSFKMFELEIKKDEAGAIVGDYKPLKNRFFMFRGRFVQEDIYILDTLVSGFYLADFKGQSWKDVVNNKYRRIGALLSSTRIHKIEVALSKYDVSTLDLTKQYFFEQENAFYILNKLTWKNGKTSVGEFVRVKR